MGKSFLIDPLTKNNVMYRDWLILRFGATSKQKHCLFFISMLIWKQKYRYYFLPCNHDALVKYFRNII